jgi:NAD/NADP transhydrogenase beta subunit
MTSFPALQMDHVVVVGDNDINHPAKQSFEEKNIVETAVVETETWSKPIVQKRSLRNSLANEVFRFLVLSFCTNFFLFKEAHNFHRSPLSYASPFIIRII